MKNKLRLKKGFTIIELIVVVAILGILVLLAGPRLLGYVEKAEYARIQHDVKIMENKMAEVLNTDNKFNDWLNSGKDLGIVVLRKELYEKQGPVKSIDWEHLSVKSLRADKGVNQLVNKNDELGVGGDLIEIDDKYSTYKIIPKEYSSKINTKLKGTFYVNLLGKVYYEHDKPLTKAIEKEVLACVAPETLNYEFKIIDELGTIIGWNSNATHLVIPASFKMSKGGKEWCEPVRVIGAGAFQDGTFEKVTIPQSVEEIQDEAFQGGELIEIEIPHSVKTVGDNVFAGNPATSSGGSSGSGGSGGGSTIVKGSSDGRNISGSAFGGSDYTYSPVSAKDLDVITKTKNGVNSGGKTVSIIGKTTTSDSSSSNSRDYSNTVINIPKELEIGGEVLPVTEIDSGAFQGSGLIDVIMPEGLLYIHDYAFAGNQLIRAIIPSSVIEVGNYAFAYNEIESEPTINPINILEGKFSGNYDHVNNEGNISKPVSTIDLKDHIFITSSMGNHVIEDVGANPKQPGDNVSSISVPSLLYPGETHTIQWGSISDWGTESDAVKNKYKLEYRYGENDNYKLLAYVDKENTSYNNYINVGKNITQIQYRIRAENLVGTTDWLESDIISVQKDSRFELIGADTYVVPSDGVYHLAISGAQGGRGGGYSTMCIGCSTPYYSGGSGGSGATVGGIFELKEGDVLNINIGRVGSSGSSGGRYSESATSGFSGGESSVYLNDSKLISAKGGGGGGAATYSRNGYAGSTGGGSGVNYVSSTGTSSIKGVSISSGQFTIRLIDTVE